MIKTKNIQQQYQGYINTPVLWKNTIEGLHQLEPLTADTTIFDIAILENVLLGKRVEQFVYHELTQYDTIDVLLENIQIQNGKITIGEIDAFIKVDNQPIHLEIVYKFYLYDETVGTSELAHWIGPNRKDHLVKKLTKLKDKQFPLLYNKFTLPTLKELALDPLEIQQRVYFKAQLFVPYKTIVDFELLNKDCVKGFYVPYQKVAQFADCKFIIPKKTDWLLEVQAHAHWMNYLQFIEKLTVFIDDKRAPLCWIKFTNGILQKFFVVWW